MNIYLDVNSETPLYQQIRNEIILGLAEQRIQNGDPLPSTRQLAADFGINFHTVSKAYDMLRQEGLLRVNRKTGAVVSIDKAGPEFQTAWQESARILLAEALVKGMGSAEVLAECAAIVRGFDGTSE